MAASGHFAESVVEEAALDRLRGIGWQVAHGSHIAPGELKAERNEYGQVVLERRLRDALARLNPTLAPEAVEDSFRKVTRVAGPSLDVCNRAVHRSLVNGVTLEYPAPGGSIRGPSLSPRLRLGLVAS